MKLAAIVVILLSLFVRAAAAHESLPAYLGVTETTADTFQVEWRVPATQGQPPALSPAFPSQCTTVSGPTLSQAPGNLVGRMTIHCGPPGLRGGRITLSGLSLTVLDALVDVSFADGTEITQVLRPDTPELVLADKGSRLDAIGYFRLGFTHILFGVDHLLFVLGLLLIVRGGLALLKTVTSFTLAHSITLAIATLGHVSLPMAPLNAAIALSILFLGPEILRAKAGRTSLTIRHPWVVAFAFGLLHGFGFASGLSVAGLPMGKIPVILLLFNLGVEVGQIVFVGLILGLARAFRLMEIHWPKPVALIPTYTVGVLGAFWTIQRLAIVLGGGS